MDLGSPTSTMRHRQPLDVDIRVGPADRYPVLEGYLAGERDAGEREPSVGPL